MKRFSILLAITACFCAVYLSAVVPAIASVNVTQHHNHDSRDGLFIDSIFTLSNAANAARDTNFNGTISGNVYAQPLYVEGGPGGISMVIVVTESNNVYALGGADGNVVWQRNLGAPVPSSGIPCGNISPVGITGTPVIHLPSRSLFLDAMIDGSTKKHFIYSLNVDSGAINPGWPVDVNAAAVSGGNTFTSQLQNQRGALGLVNNIVYVPYSGLFGECGTYRGWVVGVPVNNPASVTAWANPVRGGGIWGHGGVASDGTNAFVVTGNTAGQANWSGADAVIRFLPGPVFSGSPVDFWVPTNWLALDTAGLDLAGSGPILFDVPGATPSSLVVALGMDGKAYLLDRNNLGGITAPVASATVSTGVIAQAGATYMTHQGSYVAFRANNTTLSAFRITPTNPPTISMAWSVAQSGRGSPFVTTTNGIDNVIVWVVGAEGDQRLHGYNADTGAVIYGGGGASELMAGTRRFNTGIAARGRIYVANDNKVYAFVLPLDPTCDRQCGQRPQRPTSRADSR